MVETLSEISGAEELLEDLCGRIAVACQRGAIRPPRLEDVASEQIPLAALRHDVRPFLDLGRIVWFSRGWNGLFLIGTTRWRADSSISVFRLMRMDLRPHEFRLCYWRAKQTPPAYGQRHLDLRYAVAQEFVAANWEAIRAAFQAGPRVDLDTPDLVARAFSLHWANESPRRYAGLLENFLGAYAAGDPACVCF